MGLRYCMLKWNGWVKSLTKSFSYLLQDGHENRWQDIDMQELSDDEGVCFDYSGMEFEYQWTTGLGIGHAPHPKPEVLDIFFGKNQLYDRAFTEFGG